MLMMTTIGAASAPPTTGDGLRDPGKVVLRTHALTKRFSSVLAVDSLDIDVRAGEVLGFLGPNGSGKSTTVGMILGLIEPTSGKVEFHGQDLARCRNIIGVNRSIGAIIETPAFYPYLSGIDNLRALAIAAGGVPGKRIDELIEMVGLTERRASAFKTYSLGMKQRLGIASTLLTDPDLVILDEPTNGLDPAGQREVRELIPRLAREGRAVLLASHLLNEVEQVCDRVAIIRRGKLLQFGSVADLLRRGAFIEVVLPLPDLERAAATVRDLPYVGRVSVDGGRLQVVAHEEHGGEINRALANAGFYAAAIVPRKSRLEDVFLEMTESETPQDERGADDGAAAA